MDVFGNYGESDVEVVHNILDPAPVYLSGRFSQEFCEGMKIHEADLVIVRNTDALPENHERFLGNHYEISRNTGSRIYIGESAPNDFPGRNPCVVEHLVEDGGVEELVNDYLEQNRGKYKRTKEE